MPMSQRITYFGKPRTVPHGCAYATAFQLFINWLALFKTGAPDWRRSQSQLLCHHTKAAKQGAQMQDQRGNPGIARYWGIGNLTAFDEPNNTSLLVEDVGRIDAACLGRVFSLVARCSKSNVLKVQAGLSALVEGKHLRRVASGTCRLEGLGGSSREIQEVVTQ